MDILNLKKIPKKVQFYSSILVVNGFFSASFWGICHLLGGCFFNDSLY